MPFRRCRLPAVLGLLLCLLIACTPVRVVPRPQPPPVSDVHALDRFYEQKLSWGNCAPYATGQQSQDAFRTPGVECARLTVPLDYAKPRGDTITVGVLRHKAADPADRLGSLVLNPGGPGGSGMEAAARLVPTVADNAIGLRFDLVGFDPRGVGASEPRVHCLTDAERDAERAAQPGDGTTPASAAAWTAQARDFAAKCAQRTGAAMLANVGTRDVVKDLDVLRAALGDDKLSYLGYSYGTQIGYSYAEAFPTRVRAMVLDGAIDPTEDESDSLVGQGEGFSRAFGLFAAECAKHSGCAVGQDPARAVQTFENLTKPLLTHAARAGTRSLSYGDGMTGVVEAMYSQQSWPTLNAALNLLKSGDGSLLLQLADSYYERGPDGRYSSLQDAYYAVRCVDNPRVQDPAGVTEVHDRMLAAAPFLGGGRPDEGEPDVCASWPVPSTSQPHRPFLPGVPPPLVISTRNDPATPYQAGVDLAAEMGGGLVTYEGAQHTAFLHGNQCVDVNALAYLVDGTLPPPNTSCPA
ncbi:pimeloyl-ACP methyl ester carboxylesterase [Amycolatopsis bartoniae]|uniref:Alpha/beta hydrolase n=1 Tax=Amycolatopsis bartoniae TaxID=941986 RepID=A0A8H9J2A1_9PSEU|nr:alpha/beta hydrolase [Amycolatopsis bartoniae]MBB2938802.1 pimeloyl-ACP methyl ester carboxylesterase [Amycolatopsis bartoniae]TVS99209.1 alpha/beta hydrolase [Amycolatopsis bartoniae]GHF89052.1 alpha/beta hydrolase [Amycolatopsis bartoniae]